MKTLLLRRCLSCFAALAGVVTLTAADSPFARGKWMDLSHDFSTNTLYWPTAQRFSSEVEFHSHTDKGYFYDYGQSTLFESHRILFARNIPAFENVAALDQLPATGAYIVALPMKIKDGSGGPLRIVAWVPDKP